MTEGVGAFEYYKIHIKKIIIDENMVDAIDLIANMQKLFYKGSKREFFSNAINKRLTLHMMNAPEWVFVMWNTRPLCVSNPNKEGQLNSVDLL